jgi:hypothetical protein
MANRAEHQDDLGVIRTDMAFDERAVVLELAQGRSGFMAHDFEGIRRLRAVPHVGAPLSFCLRVWKRMRFVHLRRRIEPVSPESCFARGGLGA